MTIINVSPKLIRPNPWQTRIDDDPAHVRELSESIKKNGMLQTPIGRKFPGDKIEGRIQLAVGHSRLAAWIKAFPDRMFIPIDVRPLTDREMADAAIEENERRKNLSAIEKATAIKHYMESFKVGQLEAGKPFGLATQGAVANVLALQWLPAGARQLVHEGKLPERHARALIPFAKIDPNVVNMVAKKISSLGTDREINWEIKRRLYERHGRELNHWRSDQWPLSWPKNPLKNTVDIKKRTPDELPACIGCSFLRAFNNDKFCLRPPCFKAKKTLWKQRKEKSQKRFEKKNKAEAPAPKKEKPDPKIQYALEASRLIEAALPILAPAIPAQLVDLLQPSICSWNERKWKQANLPEKRRLLMAELLPELVPHFTFEVRKPAETIKRIQAIARTVRIKLPRGWDSLPSPKKGGHGKGKRKGNRK